MKIVVTFFALALYLSNIFAEERSIENLPADTVRLDCNFKSTASYDPNNIKETSGLSISFLFSETAEKIWIWNNGNKFQDFESIDFQVTNKFIIYKWKNGNVDRIILDKDTGSFNWYTYSVYAKKDIFHRKGNCRPNNAPITYVEYINVDQIDPKNVPENYLALICDGYYEGGDGKTKFIQIKPTFQPMENKGYLFKDGQFEEIKKAITIKKDKIEVLHMTAYKDFSRIETWKIDRVTNDFQLHVQDSANLSTKGTFSENEVLISGSCRKTSNLTE